MQCNSIHSAQIETKYTRPNETEIEEIFQTVDDQSKCQGLNQWTPWKSIKNPASNNGSDYEIIQDHKNLLS